jgi:aspartyl-tRNA(Asn)/glutamyl-tRNA(Gln) amidotransferase subunit A
VRTLAEQAAAVASGDVSPRELVEASLAAIERTQPALNAFTHVLADAAIARAKELEGVSPVGPLHGVPMAIKELYDVEGTPTTGCCEAYRDRIAASDSAVVSALRASGAIVVGKTNQHELAEGGTTQNSSFGAGWNPWDARRMTGGSSGGSAAAVGAGVVSVAMGSDSLGSIRIPSSWCGATGLKTTHGAVSLRGAMPFLPSCDSAGPIATDARDCVTMWRVLAGFDAGDPFSVHPGAPPRASGRIALMRRWLQMCAREVRVAVEDAARLFESLGVGVEEIEGPDPDVWSWFLPVWGEFADAYRDLWDGGASQEATFLFDLGRGFGAVDAAEMWRRRRAYGREFEAALDGFDALLAPATAFPAPLGDQQTVDVEGGQLDVRAGCARFTAAVNAVGFPSLSFPSGFSPDGLPLGAQLIGAPWSEETLCDLGARFQGATEYHTRAPA